MARPIKVVFDIEVEYGSHSVTYEVRAEVAPGSPGRLSGPPEDCYPDEPAEVTRKEVYYIDEKVRCPEMTRSPRLHFGMVFPKYVDGEPVTPDGRKCVKCQGTGLIKQSFRRPELDDLVDDEQVMEHIPEPDEDPRGGDGEDD